LNSIFPENFYSVNKGFPEKGSFLSTFINLVWFKRHFDLFLYLAVLLTTLPLRQFLKIMKQKDVNNAGNVQENDSNTAVDINSDADVPGIGHLNDPVETGSETDKLQKELSEWKDKYVRQIAEFDNFRKRNARERLELMQTAGKEVIKDLLDVLDDCDRAQKQLENSQDLKEIKEGVSLVFNKLRNVLAAKGLKPMETIHTEFNPDLHEAITEIPAPSGELKDKVLDEVTKGYYLNDKLIRHAKVVIGK
jgi:molecular chaperone GrpE